MTRSEAFHMLLGASSAVGLGLPSALALGAALVVMTRPKEGNSR